MLTVRFTQLQVREGDRVLDLGCGAGRHSYAAMRLGADVVAADLDIGVLKEVRDVAGAVAFEDGDGSGTRPLAGCLGADGRALPFSDAAFDKVIVSEVLEHVAEDDRALAEIARVVKPEGLVAVTVPRTWPEVVCWGLSREYHSNEGGHVRIYRRSQLVGRMRAAGLEPVGAHHAHALHAPFWWLRCAVGVRSESNRLVEAYHRFLVWDIGAGNPWVRSFERALNPLVGKSLVVYARRAR